MIYCPHCTRPTSLRTGLCHHCGKPIHDETRAGAQPLQASEPADSSQTQAKPKPRRMLLGEILVGAGLITAEHLHWALAKQGETGRRLGAVLVAHRLLSEAHLIQALSHQSNLRWIDLQNFEIDVQVQQSLFGLIDLDLAEKHLMFPLDVRHAEDGSPVLFVAMDDPFCPEALAAAQAGARMQIRPVFAAPSAIEASIKACRAQREALQPRSTACAALSEKAVSSSEKDVAESESEQTVEPRRTREFSLPASLYPPRIEEPPEEGGGPKTLTLLDGTMIPWANATQKGFTERNTGFEFFEELATLNDDPDGIVRTRQYIAAMLRLMFKKKIVAPEDFRAQLDKFSLDPQK